MKAINRRLRRLDAHFTPAVARPQYSTLWVGALQHRRGLQYAHYRPLGRYGPVLSEIVRLNSETYHSSTEEEREQWLEQQRALNPPGTPVPNSPWANWNRMRPDGSIEFRE